MNHPETSSAQAAPNGIIPERDRLELIRFASADAQRQAIRVLLNDGPRT
jgi:hypothetical protein